MTPLVLVTKFPKLVAHLIGMGHLSIDADWENITLVDCVPPADTDWDDDDDLDELDELDRLTLSDYDAENNPFDGPMKQIGVLDVWCKYKITQADLNLIYEHGFVVQSIGCQDGSDLDAVPALILRISLPANGEAKSKGLTGPTK